MRIASIEHSSIEKDVYDIEVHPSHHYVANGMVSHNSLLANDMAIKMSSAGYKVLIVPLEMSKREMTSRILANLTKTNLTDITLQRLETFEKDKIYERYKRWAKKAASKGGRYTIFRPMEDMTIEEIYAATAAYNCDVVIIDYISLLRGVDGDDMWRALGGVARFAKINAETENRVNILLCQVSEEGKIRYSRAVSEHSANSWVWIASKETKEQGILKVEQPKSRNSESFPFMLKVDYSKMHVSDMPEDSMSETRPAKNNREMVNLATTDV